MNTQEPPKQWFWQTIWQRPGRRWSIVLLTSLLLHAGLFFALRVYATQYKVKRVYPKVKFRLLKRRPPPPRVRKKPPKKRVEPKKRKPPKKRKKPKKRKRRKPKRRLPPPNQRPPKRPPQRPPPPVFGVTKKSLGKGKGMAIKVGNTLMKEPDNKKLPANAKPYVAPPPTPPAPPPRGRVFAPVPIYEVDENPRELKKVQAAYPPDAKERGIQAVVVLSLQIRSNGRVRRATVVSIRPATAAAYGFGKAAIKALRKYRFRAARFKGKPVDVIVRYVYRFELED